MNAVDVRANARNKTSQARSHRLKSLESVYDFPLDSNRRFLVCSVISVERADRKILIL